MALVWLEVERSRYSGRGGEGGKMQGKSWFFSSGRIYHDIRGNIKGKRPGPWDRAGVARVSG